MSAAGMFCTCSVKCSACFLINVTRGITAASLMRDYQNTEYCLLKIIGIGKRIFLYRTVLNLQTTYCEKSNPTFGLFVA